MRYCREIGALYIDTVVEPWPGFYFDKGKGNEARTNYALRETVLAERRANPGGVTAVSCCGANPGMVSWLVKQALVNLATDLGDTAPEPASRAQWGQLAQRLGVKGIHIAERDTQRAREPKPREVFVNTWSVEGFLSEGMQPAELGWGTHERWAPANAGFHKEGCGAAIYLLQPGANTRVRSWTPTANAQFGFLVTHNESISIADYFTLRNDKGEAVYRPTCHYAYHPCDDAVLSLHELFGQAGKLQPRQSHPDRDGDRRRHRRTRRAALRPRQERLLVRLAAFGRGDAGAGALSERDRDAGDLRGARRHGLGAGEPRGRHRRGRRDGLSPLPAGAAPLSGTRRRGLHRLDAADRPAGAVPRRHRPQRPLAISQRPGAVSAPTFVYIAYGRSPYIGRELRYGLATLLAEIPDARVVVYTDRPDAYDGLHASLATRDIAADLDGWTRGGLLHHRAKTCALHDALVRDGGVCVLMDTNSYIAPGFAAALARAIADGPAMDFFEESDPFPDAAGFAAELPRSGRYRYEPAVARMWNSGLVAVEAARDGAAIEDALALVDAFLDAGRRSFKIEQVSFSETLRRLDRGVGEMRPAFQHYFRRSLKRYMHWRIDAWMRRVPDFAPTRPCIAHPRNAVRAFNLVNRLIPRY